MTIWKQETGREQMRGHDQMGQKQEQEGVGCV